MCIQNLLQATHIKVSFLSLVFRCGRNLFIGKLPEEEF